MKDRHAVKEITSHSFVLKIWLEETIGEAGRVIWRGSISHVPEGTRRYFTDLQTMADFVADFVDAIGADAGFAYRFRKKLRQWRRGVGIRSRVGKQE